MIRIWRRDEVPEEVFDDLATRVPLAIVSRRGTGGGMKIRSLLLLRLPNAFRPGGTIRTLLLSNIRSLAVTDDTVRPALIELKLKLELERKLWFFRILSPVQKNLRLLVGNPPITQQQLMTGALVIGSDVAMAAAGHLHQIEALKAGAGLTMQIEVEKIFDKK